VPVVTTTLSVIMRPHERVDLRPVEPTAAEVFFGDALDLEDALSPHRICSDLTQERGAS
jgi:hypothetical protein